MPLLLSLLLLPHSHSINLTIKQCMLLMPTPDVLMDHLPSSISLKVILKIFCCIWSEEPRVGRPPWVGPYRVAIKGAKPSWEAVYTGPPKTYSKECYPMSHPTIYLQTGPKQFSYTAMVPSTRAIAKIQSNTEIPSFTSGEQSTPVRI